MPKFYKVIAENRRARHDFEVLEVYKAGIVLSGSEVKSVRLGKVNLKDSFARAEKGELWLYGMHISPYEKTGSYKQDPTRPRKLLMRSNELKKLAGRTNQKGFAVVPLKMYFDRDWAKIDLAVGKAKKLFDKRESIKDREIKREIDKGLKERNR